MMLSCFQEAGWAGSHFLSPCEQNVPHTPADLNSAIEYSFFNFSDMQVYNMGTHLNEGTSTSTSTVRSFIYIILFIHLIY